MPSKRPNRRTHYFRDYPHAFILRVLRCHKGRCAGHDSSAVTWIETASVGMDLIGYVSLRIQAGWARELRNVVSLRFL